MATMRKVVTVWAAAILWIPAAIAADTAANPAVNRSGAMPGDDALTCEQIYGQVMAETQREQQERDQRNAQRRAQGAATGALITGAMLTGGLGGTGQAAQKAAEAQADSGVALLGTPQTNPRKEYLKQLWTQKHCSKK